MTPSPPVAAAVALWVGLASALLLAARSWLALADQPFIPVPRSLVVGTWRRRAWFKWGTQIVLAASVGLWLAWPDLAPPWAVAGSAALTLGLWTLAFFATRLMFRSRERDSAFVSVAQASRRLGPDVPMIVLEVNGEARAYTDHDLLQPHVAGTANIGGEVVTMTYCGLSNLGVAYTASIQGRPLDLHPITQLENNLILWDRRSGDLVQQLWGHLEGDPTRARMREWPTRRMPFRSFAALYPEGQVFINPLPRWRNPIAHLWDGVIRAMMRAAVRKQGSGRDLLFPTRHPDDRLPGSARVFAFHVGDDHVAYTEEFVRDHGGVLNVEVGGRPVVVAYDEPHDVLGVFYNDTGAPVERLDARGSTPQGRLPQVETLKAGVFWGALVNYVRSVDLNRPQR